MGDAFVEVHIQFDMAAVRGVPANHPFISRQHVAGDSGDWLHTDRQAHLGVTDETVDELGLAAAEATDNADDGALMNVWKAYEQGQFLLDRLQHCEGLGFGGQGRFIVCEHHVIVRQQLSETGQASAFPRASREQPGDELEARPGVPVALIQRLKFVRQLSVLL